MDRIDVSQLVESQLPGWVRSDYQTFIAFLEAYYDFLKQQGVTTRIDNIRDLDTSVAGFIEHIKSEIAPKLPLGVADNRFKLSRMTDVYDTKGSSASFKALFRMLYGNETDVEYPSKQMLIPSDGRWIQPFSIFVKFSFMSTSATELIGKLVTIKSGFQTIEVFVEDVKPAYVVSGSGPVEDGTVYELTINKNFYGKITSNSDFSFISGATGFIGSVVDGITKITIDDAGEGFVPGEFYDIKTATATGARIKVTRVGPIGELLGVELVSSGINYTDQFATTLFAKKYDVGNTQTSSISLAGSTWEAVLVDSTDATSDEGYIVNTDYVDPTTVYGDPTYVGTVIKTFSDPGNVSTIDPELAARLTITTGPLIKYPGYFATNAGFLSDALYLQDSYYYQAFSYVVKIDRKLDEYGGILKTMLHPAGTAMFGEYNINDTFSISPSIVDIVDSTPNSPSLSLNFLDGTSIGDPRITYSGGTGGTCVNSAGFITAASAPRIDYNPITLACRGVLIEEQRTNLAARSEQFDNTAWTKSNATIAADATTAPSGSTTADALVENTATGVHEAQQSGITITTGLTYTGSMFVKSGAMTKGDVRIKGSAGQCLATFDLAAGTVTATNSGVATGTTATITPFINGWYRVTVSGVAGASDVSIALSVNSRDASNATSYLGTGVTALYVWGAQLEAGSFATSYIPTTTAAVTRTADSLVMAGSNFSSWFNQKQGVFYAEGDSASIGGVNRFFMSANDGTISNEFNLFVTSSGGVQASITAGGVPQGSPFSSTVLAANSTIKAALVYDTSYLNGAVDGSILPNGSPATPGVIPIVSRLSLGVRGNNTFFINGHIRSLRYWPQRLPNTTLQELTK